MRQLKQCLPLNFAAQESRAAANAIRSLRQSRAGGLVIARFASLGPSNRDPCYASAQEGPAEAYTLVPICFTS